MIGIIYKALVLPLSSGFERVKHDYKGGDCYEDSILENGYGIDRTLEPLFVSGRNHISIHDEDGPV